MIRGTQTVGQTLEADREFISMCASTTQPAMAQVVTFPAKCPAVSVFSGTAFDSAVEALREFRTTSLVPPARPTEVRAVTAEASVRSSSKVVVRLGWCYSSAAASASSPVLAGSIVTVTSLTTMTTSITTTMTVDLTSLSPSSSLVPTIPVPSPIPLQFQTLSTVSVSVLPPIFSSSPTSTNTPTPLPIVPTITADFVTVTVTRQTPSPHFASPPQTGSNPNSIDRQAVAVPLGTEFAEELQDQDVPTTRRRRRSLRRKWER
ncbi:hypothetical protein M433DRAFT_137684 [Acidomyces richmondensis BFW]|nr:MAG: hypothetical protein FE78DRAFT_67501 [Acidomyces sp. 'richmondensis']KYG41894.1 hypothetical protein M433DRAFT_137684 [Acidomyces richmondensis BFW]